MLDFKALLSTIDTPALVLDKNLTIVFVNRAYLKATGILESASLGRNVLEIFPSGSSSTGVMTLRVSLEKVKTDLVPDVIPVLKYEAPALEERYGKIFNLPVFNSAGELTHILNRLEDITESITSQKRLQQLEVGNQKLEALSITKQELQASLFELQKIIDLTPATIAVFKGPEHRYVLANSAQDKLVGKPVLGKTIREAYTVEERKNLENILDGIYKTGTPFFGKELPYTFHGKDGVSREKWINLSLDPIPAMDGSISGILGVSQDVTEQVEARDKIQKNETALRIAKAQLHEAVLVSKTGFYDWDIENDKIVFNSQMQKDWGFEADTSLEKVLSLIHPDDRSITEQYIQEAMVSHRPYASEYRVIRPSDGAIIWIEAKGKVTCNEQGKPVRFLGTSVNISELAVSRMKLEESEGRLKSALENGRMGSWVIRFPEGILEGDKQFLSFHNAKTREAIKVAIARVGHPEDQPRVQEALENSMKLGVPYDCEYRILEKDGSYRWIHARGAPAYNKKGELVSIGGIAYDIDTRKLEEFAIAKARESAEYSVRELQSEREIRERFVSALTHDLRTPLTAAKLMTQILLRKSNDPEAIAVMSKRINANLDRTDRMIRDLLDANRIKAGEHIPLNLEDCRLDLLVQDVSNELSEMHGPRFQVKNEVGPIEGFWDISSLQRILENLGGNAIKYGDPESKITFFVRTKSDWVEMGVQNFGSVISPEDQAILFEAFQRTTSALTGGQKGWGIGLTLVRGIAEAHQGSVRVESSADYGTIFTVRLPLKAKGNNE